MSYVDLHVHSNASDGTFTPSELVLEALKTPELSVIALTDHDCIDGIEEAMDAAMNTSLTIVPGTELSCYYEAREIHILGLFIDYKSDLLKHELEHLKEERLNRNLKMIELFNRDGIPMSMEKLCAGNPNTVITRAHFARVLVEEGVCKTKDAAFKKYIGVGCPYYLPKVAITPEYALKLIKGAGGLAILAHPLLYKLGYSQIETMINYLIPLGLDGIEAYHSSNNWYESDKLRSLALKYNLLITGGSDFHGGNKPDIALGKGRGGLYVDHKIYETLSII